MNSLSKIRSKKSGYAIYLIFFFCALIVCALSILMRILPYVANHYYFEVGFDTGIYEQLATLYTSSNAWPVVYTPPSFPTAYIAYMKSIEPGFFVSLSLANSVIGADIRWLFRYYVPSLVGVMTVLIAFVAGRNLSRSNLGGWISALIVAFSYIQIDATSESYYRQIFATIILVMSLIYLDRYIENKQLKNLALFTFLACGIVVYHISVIMLVSFVYIILLALLVRNRDRSSIKHFIISIITLSLLSAPAWASRIEYLSNTFLNAISETIWRVSTFPYGEGLWSAGGAIPYALWNYPHILLGYCLLFFTLVAFSAWGYFVLWKEHRLHYTIPVLSVVLWFYIALWFFFGNRLILNLDILLCVIAPVGLLYLKKKLPVKFSKNMRAIVTVTLCAVLILPISIISIDSQIRKSPYITENIEAINWIENNISMNNSVIFAPDYLSANLIQLGYLMAVWDFSLSNDSTHPMTIAEEFMVNAPSNLTYIQEFFTEHTDYKEKEIYVLWGTWDLDRPLVMTKKLIPVDDYASSPYFKCVYHGYAEILYIYKYVGPTDF